MRVLVCGGRDYEDRLRVIEVLSDFHACRPISLIIEGGATGVDDFGRLWANHQNVACTTFHADWEKHGRAAGPIRNKQMLTEGKPDLVIAFPGGRGTANMMKQAREAGIEVIEVLP